LQLLSRLSRATRRAAAEKTTPRNGWGSPYFFGFLLTATALKAGWRNELSESPLA
jgi:hypothetical protein